MSKVVTNPLAESHLEAAAHLCLETATYTNRDQWPLGLGDQQCREHHQRRHRFQEALTKMKTGVTPLSDLGLSHKDCLWAASKAERIRDQEEWRLRFQEAAEQLKPNEENA